MITYKNILKAIKDPLAALLFLLKVNRSYAQAGEDFIINGLVNNNAGFYIDIGANHPIRGNNTYMLYKKGWHGINIEPNKKMLEKFHKIRPNDTNLQIGIGKIEEEIMFYIFDEHQMCTSDLETVKRYKKIGYKVIDSYKVPFMTLEGLFDKYCQDRQVDVISIDVEGFDMDVLQSNNRNKYRPSYIILETIEYGRNGKHTWISQNNIFDPYLQDKGYEVIANTGINTIYKNIQ